MKEQIFLRAFARLRGLILKLRINLGGGQCGSHLLVGPRVRFKYSIPRGVKFGNHVEIGSDVEFHIDAAAELVIGNRTKFTGYSFISAARSIQIGNDGLVAEFVSIRDADHGMDVHANMSEQDLRSSQIVIGHNCWIGRGAAVLRGSHLGDGCVVAANAVVKGVFDSRCVLAGIPARILKNR